MTREEAMEFVLNPDKAPAVGSAEHREFLAFLDGSPADREIFDAQAALFDTLDEWQPVEPSEDFDRRLLELAESRRPWYAGGYASFLSAFGELRFAQLGPGFALATAVMVLAAALVIGQGSDRPRVTKVALADPAGSEASRDYFDEIDRAFEDMEMLADFDALALEEKRADRS